MIYNYPIFLLRQEQIWHLKYITLPTILLTETIPAAPAVFIHNAYCDVASDYHKKKNVLRLRSADGAESLIEAASPSDMKEWISKVQYYAGRSTYSLVLHIQALYIIHMYNLWSI